MAHSDTSINIHPIENMIPPRGFRAELYPLTHRVIYSFGLSAVTTTKNSAYATLIRNGETDVLADTIQVNPHNSAYETDNGPSVRKMSIIDKMRLSIKFNLTNNALNRTIDALPNLHFIWRPIHFSFREKLDAKDDDTTTLVSAILNLTVDDTNEDVVPLTAVKLPAVGVSDKSQPISTVNQVEAFGDYNMTTDLTMEGVAHDEDLFQDAIMRFTNKGALKACVGRTRHVTLSPQRPFANFFFNKFVPRSVRRIMPFSFMAILVHVPTVDEIDQSYITNTVAVDTAHLGCKIIAKYHEWNVEHDQDMGTPG